MAEPTALLAAAQERAPELAPELEQALAQGPELSLGRSRCRWLADRLRQAKERQC